MSLLFVEAVVEFPLPNFVFLPPRFLYDSLQETYEAKRKEFLSDLQHKEEEMRQMFVNRVKETEAELKEKEREVRGGMGSGLFHCCLQALSVCVVLHI